MLARLAALRRRQPRLAEIARMPRLWDRAAWACLLHDLGKVAAGFQAMLRGGEAFPHRHEVLSLAFLPWVVGPDDPHEDGTWIAAGVVSHHKDGPEIEKKYPRPDEDEGDPLVSLLQREISVELAEEVRHWLVEEAPRVLAACGLGELGLAARGAQTPAGDFWPRDAAAAVRRALGAYARLRRRLEEPPGDDEIAARFLRGLVMISDHAGSAHEDFRSVEAITTVRGARRALNLEEDSLFPHQRQAADTDGNAILRAPTGSGKTEAALLWAARQIEHGEGRPVLFYVLPYQASMNAMRERLGKAMGEEGVQLQHSRSLEALYRRLLDKGYAPKHAESVAREERELGRLHASAVRIVSPYQLLRASFGLPGHEALWTNVSGGLFVLDEIHAYEPARLAKILATVGYLVRDLGARALVLSATLPTMLRGAVEEALGGAAPIAAAETTFERFRRHRLVVRAGDMSSPGVIAEMATQAAAGQAILVVANTVARARALRRTLQEVLGAGGPRVELLHGRFNARDRFGRERVLQARVGTRTRKEAALLVATQVVEVSLDVDFDVLYSDPAPLEALLQRFGRVNRGLRHPERPVYVMDQPADGCGIYDPRLVERALQILRRADGSIVDEAEVQTWLDEVYEGLVAAWWNSEVQRSVGDFRTHVLGRVRAFTTSPELGEAFDAQFDGSEVLPAVLQSEYDSLLKESAIEASSLLVPITTGALWALRRAKKLRRRPDGIYVAQAEYTADDGLLPINAEPSAL